MIEIGDEFLKTEIELISLRLSFLIRVREAFEEKKMIAKTKKEEEVLDYLLHKLEKAREVLVEWRRTVSNLRDSGIVKIQVWSE